MRGEAEVNSLARYIEQIVEPTYEDFKRNPTSRLAFLTCVAIYHGIDRASEDQGISRGNIRKIWRETIEFTIVDVVAHHFKHVKSSDEKIPADRPGLPISYALGFKDEGDELELHHLYFLMRDAIKFLHQQAAPKP
jgi:hypothetical protein